MQRLNFSGETSKVYDCWIILTRQKLRGDGYTQTRKRFEFLTREELFAHVEALAKQWELLPCGSLPQAYGFAKHGRKGATPLKVFQSTHGIIEIAPT